MEDAGALWTTDQSATSTRRDRSGPKATTKKAETEASNDDGGKNEDATVPVTPKSKARNPKKTPAKIPSSSTKRGRKARDSDIDDEGTAQKETSTKKKAKVAPGPITEGNGIKEIIKQEPDDGRTGDEEQDDVAEDGEDD